MARRIRLAALEVLLLLLSIEPRLIKATTQAPDSPVVGVSVNGGLVLAMTADGDVYMSPTRASHPGPA